VYIFFPCASSAMEAAKETEFDTKVAYRMRMISERQIHAQRRENEWLVVVVENVFTRNQLVLASH